MLRILMDWKRKKERKKKKQLQNKEHESHFKYILGVSLNIAFYHPVWLVFWPV